MNFIVLKESFTSTILFQCLGWALQNLAINGATVSSCQFLGCTITRGIINIFDFDSHNFIGQAFNIYIAELA